MQWLPEPPVVEEPYTPVVDPFEAQSFVELVEAEQPARPDAGLTR
jgi:hypothetical protein